MTDFSFHPVDLGDLPREVTLISVLRHLPLSERTIRNHWKELYFDWIKRSKIGGLILDVKGCDNWLDQRGYQLLSTRMLAEKRVRNPGWVPLRDRISGDVLTSILLRMHQGDGFKDQACEDDKVSNMGRVGGVRGN